MHRSCKTSVPTYRQQARSMGAGGPALPPAEARFIVESWWRFYNTLRPHGLLGYSPPCPGGLHSAIRAGGGATPACFAARASAQPNHALTFNPNHSFGADLSQP